MRTTILTAAVAVASAFTVFAQPGQTLLTETLNMDVCHQRFAPYGVSKQELIDSIIAAGYVAKPAGDDAILIQDQGKNYIALAKNNKYNSFAVQIPHDRLADALATFRIVAADAKLLNTLELTNEPRKKMYATRCAGVTHFVMMTLDNTYNVTIAYGYVQQ